MFHRQNCLALICGLPLRHKNNFGLLFINPLIFKKQTRKKTNRQLGYWFSVLLPHTVEGLREAGHDTLFNITVGDHSVGVETDIDTTDILLKTLYKAYKGLDKLPLKRNMTTEEMSDLLEFALRWAAENLGIFIPTPKED